MTGAFLIQDGGQGTAMPLIIKIYVVIDDPERIHVTDPGERLLKMNSSWTNLQLLKGALEKCPAP